jgi:methionyl-tRNA synthetase
VPISVGGPIAVPTPIFAKLDSSVVDEELARLDPGDEK